MAASDQTVKVTLVAVSGPFNKGMAEASSAASKLVEILTARRRSQGHRSSLSGHLPRLRAWPLGPLRWRDQLSWRSCGTQSAAVKRPEQSVGGVDAVFFHRQRRSRLKEGQR